MYRSPDQTPLDFYVWGTLKDAEVYARPVRTRQGLFNRIEDACNKIKQNGNELRVITSY